ncbi:hypothetical protein [Chitinophaga oryziterrae]|nr:hypothetical protein [Chitinophaga oryziterrae]
MTTMDQQRILTPLSNYDTVRERMNDMGKHLFGDSFHIGSKELGVKAMVAWALGRKKAAKELGVDLKKGLLVVGLGSRKNNIMELIRLFTIEPDYQPRFEKVTCAFISNAFSVNGPAAILPYITDSVKQKKDFCFIELGEELKSRHYSTSCYVMEQIIHTRCEQYLREGILTHVTSSLTSPQIEARYGFAMRDYLRNSFNRIVIRDEEDDGS